MASLMSVGLGSRAVHITTDRNREEHLSGAALLCYSDIPLKSEKTRRAMFIWFFLFILIVTGYDKRVLISFNVRPYIA